MKWWDMAGARVDDPADYVTGYDFEIERPTYGPHIEVKADNRGHSVTIEQRNVADKKAKKNIWPIATCECGWQDHAGNYVEHVATFPMREVIW